MQSINQILLHILPDEMDCILFPFVDRLDKCYKILIQMLF